MCALREFLLGLVFFIRPWRREGVKFDIQLWVDLAAGIFFSVDRLNRCQRKKVIQQNPGRYPYSSEDFLPLVHLC